MITFQAIIEEARKQKEWIVHSLYENMKAKCKNMNIKKHS